MQIPGSGFRRTTATLPGLGRAACRSAALTDSSEVNCIGIPAQQAGQRDLARSAKLLPMIWSIGNCVRLIRCEEKSNGRTRIGVRLLQKRRDFFLGNIARRARIRVGLGRDWLRGHHCTTKLVNRTSSTSAPPCFF